MRQLFEAFLKSPDLLQQLKDVFDILSSREEPPPEEEESEDGDYEITIQVKKK